VSSASRPVPGAVGSPAGPGGPVPCWFLRNRAVGRRPGIARWGEGLGDVGSCRTPTGTVEDDRLAAGEPAQARAEGRGSGAAGQASAEGVGSRTLRGWPRSRTWRGGIRRGQGTWFPGGRISSLHSTWRKVQVAEFPGVGPGRGGRSKGCPSNAGTVSRFRSGGGPARLRSVTWDGGHDACLPDGG